MMVLQVGPNGIAMLPPFAVVDIPAPPPGARLREQVRRLQDRVEQQARLIERQADHIDLLEQLVAPPQRRGLARLRRSPWWLRTMRRLGLAA